MEQHGITLMRKQKTSSLKFRLECKVNIKSNHHERLRTHVLHSTL